MELTDVEKEVFEILETTAKKRSIITYSELGRQINVPPRYLAKILFRLQSKLNIYSYPKLNYLVVNTQSYIPGCNANAPHNRIEIDPIKARNDVWNYYKKNKLEYNGIYYYHFSDISFYLRFYDNGIIVADIDNKKEINKLLFYGLGKGKEHKYFDGDYKIIDNNIQFIIESKDGKEKYITSGKIKWDWDIIIKIKRMPLNKEYLGTFQIKKLEHLK